MSDQLDWPTDTEEQIYDAAMDRVVQHLGLDTLVEVERILHEANPHHDQHGKFASGGSSHGHAAVDAQHAVPHLTKIVGATHFDGKRVPQMHKLNKKQLGDVAENVAIGYLHQVERQHDARHANTARSNFPVDVAHDHSVVEVKGGNIGNTRGAQQWRLTIGEPGKREKAILKAMPKSAKGLRNDVKEKAILERKAQAMADLSKRLGHPVKARTITAVMNHDARIAHIYSFDGFHPRIGWNSPQAKAAYVGSYRY